MAPKRDYIRFTTAEIEQEFKLKKDDLGILLKLKAELEHRKRQSAKNLLETVNQQIAALKAKQGITRTEPTTPKNKPHAASKPTLKSSSQTAAKPETRPKSDSKTEPKAEQARSQSYTPPSRPEVIRVSNKEKTNQPPNILDAWTIIEALSPQNYRYERELAFGKNTVAKFDAGGRLPWERGEKSLPRHQLYYLVYLGAVDLQLATTNLLKVFEDSREERVYQQGFASMGCIIVNKDGVPIPDSGLSVASFPWAYGRAVSGKLGELKNWPEAEEQLVEGLERQLYREDSHGKELPLDHSVLVGASRWLQHKCELYDDEVRLPSFAIRCFQAFGKNEPEPPVMNSFFLSDLQLVKQNFEQSGMALQQYVGRKKFAQEVDLLKDHKALEEVLRPKQTPAARWPAPGRHSLVLLQQAAVNIAVNAPKVAGGLVSVNGPPGTGKTTLLRDIVASAVLDRAIEMSKFDNPEKAFIAKAKTKIGSNQVSVFSLDPSLRGHEVVIASSNNKAVENVSRELPQRDQIAEDIGEFSYFRTISDAIAGTENSTWGLMAAVLGNSSNRYEFSQAAWWNEDTGLKAYFGAITSRFNFPVDDNGDDIIPLVVSESNAPASPETALQRWSAERAAFERALSSAQAVLDKAQESSDALNSLRSLRFEEKEIALAIEAAQSHLKSTSQQSVQFQSIKDAKLSTLSTVDQKLEQHNAVRPSWFAFIFFLSKAKSWKVETVRLQSMQGVAMEEFRVAESNMNEHASKLTHAKTALNTTIESQQNCLREIERCKRVIDSNSSVCEGYLIQPGFEHQPHRERQLFTPNFSPRAQQARDELFTAAMKLHKAFIDASAVPLAQNMAALFHVLGNRKLKGEARSLLADIWASGFLVTPVVSTTFASVSKMFGGLSKESLGWLLIDEAGQASPQYAIGAIYRARNVIAVGDPLQVEPVVTLPTSLIEGIAGHMGVDSIQYTAPDASTQQLADAANKYFTHFQNRLSQVRVGIPLLVHRRCESPMFEISNKLAYANMMVYATREGDSRHRNVFGGSTGWIDVPHGTAEEKWCPEEGKKVEDMLLSVFRAEQGMADVFVITPFRIVADKLRQVIKHALLRENFSDDLCEEWVADHIGTVHTFQGKEAETVIFVLGAQGHNQEGARRWATNNVNLLNVAVSRAQKNFYVVGNKALWAKLGNMQVVSALLK